MHIIRGLSELHTAQSQGVAAIGNYDGVHLGHQAILSALCHAQPNLPLTVVTFEPTPKEFFDPEYAPPRLSALPDKLTRLEVCGVQQVLVLDFDAELAAMSADEFVQQVLVDGLQIHTLSVGEDYRYGANRAGDVATLAAYPLALLVQNNVLAEQARISSTRIRKALLAGDLALAENMLGESYWLSGEVVQGQQLGRTMGFPTLNIDLQNQRPPLGGVYAVTAELDGQEYDAVANYGTRPTVDNGQPSLEVHVLDFANDVYGQRCRVKFRSKIRDEKRFADLSELQQQIEQDVQATKAYFQSAAHCIEASMSVCKRQ